MRNSTAKTDLLKLRNFELDLEKRSQALNDREADIKKEEKRVQKDKQTLETRKKALEQNRKHFYAEQRKWKKTQNQLSKERLKKDEVVLPRSKIQSMKHGETSESQPSPSSSSEQQVETPC